MGNESRLDRWLSNLRLDVIAGILGLVLALAMFPLRFLSSQIYIETLPVVLGTASGLYLLAVRGERSGTGAGTGTRRETRLPRLGGVFARLAPTAVFLGLAAMVVVAVTAGERTIHFYDLGGLVTGLVLAQALFLREEDLSPALILTEVIALAFVVRFAALYTAPGFIGVDIWSHATYARAILDERSLDAIAESKYYASPFFHLLAVLATLLYDVSLRNGLYLSVGVVMPLVALFVYATARLLVPVRWALFAATLYAVADHAVRWGIHLIPTSLGLVFFLATLYCLARLLHTEDRNSDFALVTVFSVAVVLTHQISSFIMLVLFGCGLVAQLLLRTDLFRSPDAGSILRTNLPSPTNLAGLIVFDAGLTTFMWSLTPYQGDTFLETVLSYLYVTLTSSAGFLNGVSSEGSATSAAAGGPPPFLVELATYVDTLGFLLLLFGAAVGGLTVLRRRRASHLTYTLIAAVVVMLVFVLGLPLFNVTNFVPGRWIAFLYAPLAVLAAVGLGHLARALSPRVVVPCLLVFVLVFPGVMLMSSDGTPDSPVFTGQNERLAYTETELAAVDTIDGVTNSSAPPLYTDHPYQTVFIRTDTHAARPIELRNGRATLRGPTVYREYQSDGGSFFTTPNGAAVIRDVPRSRICPPSANHVYANGDVRVCLPRGSAG